MSFTNKLIHESSPYLLQHAHNPVNWFPWGNEAIESAKKHDKPILVSIGYSACHWCHVMEKESFEDEATAAFMNAHFINIKIDREERPDLDHIYMDAVQAIAGNGGWPLNVFLTTDLKPFYGGTYFPKQRAFNRAWWLEVLQLMNDAWLNRRDEIEQQAEVLTDHIKKTGSLLFSRPSSEADEIYTEESALQIKENLMKNADRKEGGFGNAPKFPQTFSINYLLMYGYFFSNDEAANHAIHSLKKILRGGIYDHLAGGLCRYSTDSEWLVPHFEKMLYDNALLMVSLAEAFQITQDKEFEKGMESVFHFLISEMKNALGGFYAALDADSEGEEGKFYVWDKKEVEKIITEDTSLCCKWFGITENGNWEHKNILTRKHNVLSFATSEKIEVDALENKVATWTEALLKERNKRIRPGTDDKIILGWNALLINGMCKAYAATGKELYKNEAVALYNFLQENFINYDGVLMHTFKNGQATIPAFSDDYAYLIEAAIQLQEITGVQQYLSDAKRYCELVIDNFSAGGGLFYYTAEGEKNVVIRKVEIYDGAVPSGNSVMADNLLYLSVVFDDPAFSESAHTCLTKMMEVIKKYPSSFGNWGRVFLKQVLGVEEIAITGKKYGEMLKGFLQVYLPNRILQSADKEENFPILKYKSFEEQTFIYRCNNYTCSDPVITISDLKKQLVKKS